jgi:hypothetical protein
LVEALVLSDDVFADADLKRPTQFVRSKEAKGIERGELVDALVHPKIALSACVEANVPDVEAFQSLVGTG